MIISCLTLLIMYRSVWLQIFNAIWIFYTILLQVTFLHLFHHSSITVVVGSILPFDYNGDMYLPIMLNSANHMLVYLHYLLATLGLKVWLTYRDQIFSAVAFPFTRYHHTLNSFYISIFIHIFFNYSSSPHFFSISAMPVTFSFLFIYHRLSAINLSPSSTIISSSPVILTYPFPSFLTSFFLPTFHLSIHPSYLLNYFFHLFPSFLTLL